MNIVFTPEHTTVGLITSTYEDGYEILKRFYNVNGGDIRNNHKVMDIHDCTIYVLPINEPMKFLGYQFDQIFIQSGLGINPSMYTSLLTNRFSAEESVIKLEG